MAIPYLSDIDLNKNELQNAVIQSLGIAPSSPKAGQVYFNNGGTTASDKGLWWYNGTTWVRVGVTYDMAAGTVSSNTVPITLTGSDGTTDTVNIKGAGGATITQSDGTITITTSDTTYPAGTDAILTAGVNALDRVWPATVLHDYIATAIGGISAMRFKGTVGTGGTVTNLPTTGVKIGDTYMVNSAGTYAGQVCEVGDLIIATSTTPAWTVAQTNINGAITSISGTSPISVTGSGASRTVAHENSGVTAASKGDTSNQTPTWGGTFKVTSGTVNATGHMTAFAEHTVKIPNAVATSSAAGLMSAADKVILDNLYSYGTRRYSANNPQLTSTGGICTWTVTHNLGQEASPIVQIYEYSSGKQVMAEVTVEGVDEITIKFISSSTIAANTYSVTVVI